jgi:hypothetical protein
LAERKFAAATRGILKEFAAFMQRKSHETAALEALPSAHDRFLKG